MPFSLILLILLGRLFFFSSQLFCSVFCLLPSSPYLSCFLRANLLSSLLFFHFLSFLCFTTFLVFFFLLLPPLQKSLFSSPLSFISFSSPFLPFWLSLLFAPFYLPVSGVTISSSTIFSLTSLFLLPFVRYSILLYHFYFAIFPSSFSFLILSCSLFYAPVASLYI